MMNVKIFLLCAVVSFSVANAFLNGTNSTSTIRLVNFQNSSSLKNDSMTSSASVKLPSDFLWGFATAAYQVEGAATKDGRGSTIWDVFAKTPGKIVDGSSGDVACDSYHKWKEDIALMKQYGVKSYRFSLAWSRIVPSGSRLDNTNPAGLKFYSDVIDELVRNNITPFVTLLHWDVPQGIVEKYGGFLNKTEFAADYEHYARIAFKTYGDRVKHWLTFNEPWVSAKLGYGYGGKAPGRCSDRAKCSEGDSSTEPWIVGHSILLAHGRAVKAYRTDFQPSQKGQISITLNCDWGEPLTDSQDDKAASIRYLEFFIGWFADPIYLGDYPSSMKTILGNKLPTFTSDEVALVKGSADFFGLNHYTAKYISNPPPSAALDPTGLDGRVVQSSNSSTGELIGPQAESSWLNAGNY
jgi:beta-glucosidase